MCTGERGVWGCVSWFSPTFPRAGGVSVLSLDQKHQCRCKTSTSNLQGWFYRAEGIVSKSHIGRWRFLPPPTFVCLRTLVTPECVVCCQPGGPRFPLPAPRPPEVTGRAAPHRWSGAPAHCSCLAARRCKEGTLCEWSRRELCCEAAAPSRPGAFSAVGQQSSGLVVR